ncbi:MAG TPA: hypothetical protein RMH99_10340, partial [Sandaracinaceae bacterium LLY-WYZ-13_1]|nr:hypothetical protein [Sandaracinaceae bacterium LLY-WYZ-13_1]
EEAGPARLAPEPAAHALLGYQLLGELGEQHAGEHQGRDPPEQIRRGERPLDDGAGTVARRQGGGGGSGEADEDEDEPGDRALPSRDGTGQVQSPKVAPR